MPLCLPISNRLWQLFSADLAVAITGIAGPGGSEFKPEGRVCFGLAQAGKATETQTRDFGALGRGKVSDTVYTCDFSHDYVSINADYRS